MLWWFYIVGKLYLGPDHRAISDTHFRGESLANFYFDFQLSGDLIHTQSPLSLYLSSTLSFTQTKQYQLLRYVYRFLDVVEVVCIDF